MVEPITTGAILIALIPIIGILLKNPYIALLGAVGFLFVLGKTITLPPFMWIIVLVLMFLWIINIGKRK